MSRATYYFYVNKEDKDLKNQDIIDKIKEILLIKSKRYFMKIKRGMDIVELH